MPGISDLGPWVLIAVLLAPKILDWYQQLRGKKLDSDAAIRTADVSVEIEKIKGEFERQNSFQDDLISECQRLRDAFQKSMDHNHVLSGSVMERDAIIRDRDKTISQMQREIDQLRAEVDTLKRHVKAIETDRERLRKECPVLEEPKE